MAGMRIGYVSQNAYLFSASVRDNLTLFDHGISDERIAAVLRRSQRTRAADPMVEEIQFGDIYINFRRHEGTKQGAPLELSDRA